MFKEVGQCQVVDQCETKFEASIQAVSLSIDL